MRDMRQFWSPRRMGEDRVTMVRLGPLRLWLARAEREWGFAFEHGEGADLSDITQVPEDVVPTGLDWTKVLFEKSPREYQVKPTVPDRPVVVKPTFPVLIPDGEYGTFYSLLPCFLKITLSVGKTETTLATIPSRMLSDTWFGSAVDGELCYSLPFTAERDPDDLEPLPHHIICPIEVHNRSEEDLKFEKLCFRPRFIGIYCGDSRLWSSRVSIQHEGSYRGTTVRYHTTPPEGDPNLVQISKPESREEHRLSRLTFSSGFGKDIIFGR
jgi:hypothetical protein